MFEKMLDDKFVNNSLSIDYEQKIAFYHFSISEIKP